MSDEEEAEDVSLEELHDRLEAVRGDLEAVRPKIDPVREQVEPVREELEAAETEDDLDDVEEEIEPVRADATAVREEFDAIADDLEEIASEAPEPEDDEDVVEEAEDGPIAELAAEVEAVEEVADELDSEIGDVESEIDDLEDGVEDQRGPYAEDVIGEIDDASSTITDTRWTVDGKPELVEAVNAFLEDVNAVLDISLASVSPIEEGAGVSARLSATLEDVTDAVDNANLDPDDDAVTIAALLEATDDLASGIDDAEEWDDLTVREQLRAEGFYDDLEHVKDFPPELHALKVHEQRGNVEMILLALDSLGSEFMEDHCMDALERIGPEEAIEPMVQRANRRDTKAMSILGKVGVADEEVVETLLDYVDSNPQLQKPALRALGEVGSEEAVKPIAQQLAADEGEVRSNAARALGLIGDTRAIEPLADILADDEDDNARASAAWALNQIGTEAALEVVAEYADDRSYVVQTEAKKAQADTEKAT
ncbi:HEAT repeat domain-containing protein [Natrialbaceae archaeon A-gly3]